MLSACSSGRCPRKIRPLTRAPNKATTGSPGRKMECNSPPSPTLLLQTWPNFATWYQDKTRGRQAGSFGVLHALLLHVDYACRFCMNCAVVWIRACLVENERVLFACI